MSKKLIHRDVSWVSFNERVLQEAENQKLPLYERLKFLAIFSSNLDEFYRVRISALRQFKNLQKDLRKKLNEKPKKVIKEIQEKIFQLQERFGKTYRNNILPKLAKEHIFLIKSDNFSNKQQEFSKKYFLENVLSHVKVHELTNPENFDFFSDKELFLFLDTEKNILISIPTEDCPRFVVFPEEEDMFFVTYLDEIIRANLGEIHADFKGKQAYSVKITRDGEMYFNEQTGEVVTLIKEHLSQRDKGIPTRMLYDVKMPDKLLKRLRKQLQLNKTDLMPGGRYHNFSDFFGFPMPEGKAHLCFPEMEYLSHPELEKQENLIGYIKENDALLSFPYQKYDYIPQIIEQAAVANDIHSVNITLYRVSKQSAIAKGLLKCLENGKKVTVFIEAKARFDEANNIFWGEQLKTKGANVLYSLPNIKVHSKIFLLEGTDFEIGYIGTGNFNEKSAKLYTDFGLLTSKSGITSDLKEAFRFLQNPTITPKIDTLLMSPFTTRTTIYNKIDREIEHVKNGKKGFIQFKMNSLEDEGIIKKLYEASKAGVEIQLIVRGIFRLKPQEDFSKNIKAVSIVGKLLEHSRIYYFGNNGVEEIYIASADCMTRNLDKRVEISAPIFDQKIKEILKKCLYLQWNDNTKARILDSEQNNQYQDNKLTPINAQDDFHTFLAKML